MSRASMNLGHNGTAADVVATLRSERLRQGLTMDEVAHRVFGSFDGSHISRWEKHQMTPRLDSFIAWAQSMGLSVRLELDAEPDRPERVRSRPRRAW